MGVPVVVMADVMEVVRAIATLLVQALVVVHVRQDAQVVVD